MEKIYLKNYKGFSSQFIELTDMNFLVGENSTGKTSFLKIVNLLSSSEFWANYEFNNNDVELGYFEEIIDKTTTDRFFQLGIEKTIFDRNSKTNKEQLFRIIFEFKEEKSVPKLHHVKVEIDKQDVLIKFTKKQISFRTKNVSDQSFEKWAVDFDFPKKYKRLSFPPNQLPLYIIVIMIQRAISEKEEYKLNVSFGQEVLYDSYKWLAPIRAKAKRTYESYKIKFSAEGDHIPSILRQILGNRNRTQKGKIISILESFGKDSNLFDEIQIKELGKKDSSPFEIMILYKNVEIKLPNVGYGVSQSLPIIIEILSSKNTCFSIQQPEVHLHPKAQAAFGSFLFQAVKNDNNKFIIETHSDFMINRFRHKLNRTNKDLNFQSKVLFFERTPSGNKVSSISINNNGSYSEKVPESYRDFFIDEELKLLEI